MNNIIRFLRLPWHDRWNVVHGILVELKTFLYYSRVFRTVGRQSRIYKPIFLSNPRFISVGEHTTIRQGARIETIVIDKNHPPSLLIGNNVNIEQNIHLICGLEIVIGNDVSIAPNCGILDTKHPFRDVGDSSKIGGRVELGFQPVRIGDNTLIGFGSVILPNVQIGRYCIIGANSTVRTDIPDYCVAAGNPASIILQFDSERKDWIKVRS